MIRAAGFETCEAGTGGKALVLDVHLPDFSGFEVCRELRIKPSTATLPVVHLSATFVRNEDKVAGLNAGADAYLVHPVEPPVLIATLQALIRARMAGEKQRNSEARFRAIYDQAPTGMALIDTEGRFADVNPAMVAMLGQSRDALIGQPVSAFAPEEWMAFVKAHTAGDLGTGASASGVAGTAGTPVTLGQAVPPSAPWKGEFPLLRQDGSWIRLEWTMSAQIEPGLRVGIALDVSERFELEGRRREVLEREQAARAAAEHLSCTKDNFVAMLSQFFSFSRCHRKSAPSGHYCVFSRMGDSAGRNRLDSGRQRQLTFPDAARPQTASALKRYLKSTADPQPMQDVLRRVGTRA
ncbi:PAS domain S-box protein [Variovorax sp. J22G73]|uniref:PAS domain S-box protein n=1 Tax=unclassified Variovorax TaxID=663243 RepID=UPI0025788F35|nr:MULTISPECIES: PAS domain S-box protein [unclassified Variovorax]MDM0009538.1 PAS domain S-box protein [Variovorax sp. J22R203]MDM0102046.1 PAS domain S-box protein [Variovorax sp. J22G73]